MTVGEFLLLQRCAPAGAAGRGPAARPAAAPSGPESRTSSGTHRPPLAVAQRVEREVVGDGEQPGGELRLGAVLLAHAVDAEEHLLGQVLGLVGVADEVVHDGDEAMLVPSTSSANAAASSSRTRSMSRMSGSRRAICELV